MNRTGPAATTARFPVRDLPRLAHILRVLAQQGFGHHLGRLRLKGYLHEGAGAPVPPAVSGARRFRTALEELGPSFVKFGQMLSVRHDLFSAEVIQELQALQDTVPPFPGARARELIEQELEQPLSVLFAAFDEAPLAAASIAQVHRATLHDGASAIVKVQRPGIADVIRADVELLRFLAGLSYRYIPESRRYDPPALVEEFAENIERELDFLREGRNADQFREDFRDESAVYVPRVFWDLSSQRVLTMEHSPGRRMDADYPADVQQRRLLAEMLMRLFLTQIFEHGFFHGDPHPGNLFLLPDGRICFHDFGIVGRLSVHDQDNLRQLFLAVVARDPEWLADVYLEMGGAAPGLDRAAFVHDLAESLEQYCASSRGASFGQMLQEFMRLGRRYEIRLLRETLLVAKTLMTLESVVRTLDPEFDLFAAFQRYAPGMIARQLLPSLDKDRSLARGYRALHTMLRLGAVDLPVALAKGLQQLGRGEATLHLRHEPLESLERHIDRASNRLSFSLIIAAVVVASSLVMAFHTGPHYDGIPLLGLIGYLIAAVLGLAWAVAILRSGRF